MDDASRVASESWGRSREAKGTAIGIIGIGVFVINLDLTLAISIFPALLDDLGENVGTASWVVNAQTVGIAAGLVTGGQLGDRLGRRDVFAGGLLGYSLLALACGWVSNLPALIAIRLAMGFAGAVVFPTSMGLIAERFPPEERPRALAIWSGLAGLAGLVGPFFGAAVVRWLSWEWAFIVLGPLCIVGAVLARFRLSPSETSAAALSFWGSTLHIATVASLFGVCALGQDVGWTSVATLSAGVVAVGCVALFLAMEAQSASPQFPRDLRQPSFVRALVGVCALGFGLGAGMFSMPLFATELLGVPDASAGFVLVPAALTLLIAAFASGRIVGRYGAARIAGVSLTLSATTLLALSSLDAGSALSTLYLLSGMSGIGIGLGLPSFAGLALESIVAGSSGVGSGWYNTFRQLGTAVGVASFALVLAGVAVEEPMSSESTAAAFRLAYGSSCGITVLGLLSFGFIRRRGESLAGEARRFA